MILYDFTVIYRRFCMIHYSFPYPAAYTLSRTLKDFGPLSYNKSARSIVGRTLRLVSLMPISSSYAF